MFTHQVELRHLAAKIVRFPASWTRNLWQIVEDILNFLNHADVEYFE